MKRPHRSPSSEPNVIPILNRMLSLSRHPYRDIQISTTPLHLTLPILNSLLRSTLHCDCLHSSHRLLTKLANHHVRLGPSNFEPQHSHRVNGLRTLHHPIPTRRRRPPSFPHSPPQLLDIAPMDLLGMPSLEWLSSMDAPEHKLQQAIEIEYHLSARSP